jgi:phospholipid/cholesterol/gamma-HCH transport system substrate-binding protein
MAVKGAEVRSGVFVVLALIALSILVFSVGNFRQRLQTTATYAAFLPDAKFLKAHDPVTYGGLRVGEVTGLEVAPDRLGLVRVTVEVEQALVVKEDSALVLKQDGILGPKYLEISPGSQGARRAAAGAVLQGLVPPAITDLTAAVEKPLQQIDRLLAHLDAILGKPENQRNIGAILDETRGVLEKLTAQVDRVGKVAVETGEKTQAVLSDVQGTVRDARAPLLATLKNAEEASGRLARSLDEALARVVRNIDELTARATKTAENLDRLLKDADGMIAANHTNVYETIRSFRDTAYHLEQAARRIRSNPAILIFGADETEEARVRADETEIRLKGRARRYDKEAPR